MMRPGTRKQFQNRKKIQNESGEKILTGFVFFTFLVSSVASMNLRKFENDFGNEQKFNVIKCAQKIRTILSLRGTTKYEFNRERVVVVEDVVKCVDPEEETRSDKSCLNIKAALRHVSKTEGLVKRELHALDYSNLCVKTALDRQRVEAFNSQIKK